MKKACLNPDVQAAFSRLCFGRPLRLLVKYQDELPGVTPYRFRKCLSGDSCASWIVDIVEQLAERIKITEKSGAVIDSEELRRERRKLRKVLDAFIPNTGDFTMIDYYRRKRYCL